MQPFDYQPSTRIIFGPHRLDALGALAAELGGRRVLMVSDSGLVAVGHVQRGIDSLTRAGLQPILFDGVEENPTTRHVAAGVPVARDARIDLIVGLGGGSCLDCAKGINFLLTNGGRMTDYWGVGKAAKPMLPMIGVPTTAGTGSEVQSFALIADERTHQKMACGDKKAACRIAILDPVLTLTQPTSVTAVSGLDAIAHAIESCVSTRRNGISQAMSREAWRFLHAHYLRVLTQPDDLDARAGMLLGACLAGIAIENSMLGAAHAAANPLTARFGITHGLAVAIMLPHVIRFNGNVVADLYAELLAIAGRLPSNRRDTPDQLAANIEALVRAGGRPTSLRPCGVDRSALSALAAEAATQWTAQFNPRPVKEADFLQLYDLAF